MFSILLISVDTIKWMSNSYSDEILIEIFSPFVHIDRDSFELDKDQLKKLYYCGQYSELEHNREGCQHPIQ